MTALDRRAFLGRILAGAVVATAGATLVPGNAEAAPLIGAIADGALPDVPIEQTAVTCWWRGGRRVCARRPVRRVCWWRAGRRVCAWR
jgi:hypothetical protein